MKFVIRRLFKIEWILLILVIIYIAIFFSIACLKYQSFSFHDMDLAAINQTFWNAIHGKFISNFYGEAALLSGHKWFIIFPLIPFYALFPNPLNLLFLQSLALGLGAWAVFLLGREILSPSSGLVFAFCYLIYPALNYVNLFEFHPIAFATPLLLFTFYYYQRRNWGLYLLFLFLSLSCREDIFIPVLGLGMFALLQGIFKNDEQILSRMKWGLSAILLSIFWLVLCLKVIPGLIATGQPPSSTPTMVETFYGWLGSTPGEIVENLFLHPGKIMQGVLTKPKLLYLLHLLVPLGFVSLLSPSALIMVLVSLAEGLLSSRFTHFSIRYQYSSIITPFIFISAIYGVRNMFRWKWPVGKAKIILPVILVFSLVSAKTLGPIFRLPDGIKQWKITHEDQIRQDLVNKVPPFAPIAATFEFGPKLSMRPQLFLFYHLYASSRKPGFARKIPVMQKEAEYALIDFDDWLTFYDFYTPGGDKDIYTFLMAGNWNLTDSVNSIGLFKKADRPNLGLVSMITEQEDARLQVIPGIPSLKFAGCALNKKEIFGKPVLELQVDLKCDRELHEDLLLSARLTNSEDRLKVFQQFFFAPYRIFPTSRWEPGNIVRQSCNILIPPNFSPGAYDLTLALIHKRPGLPFAPEAKKLFYGYYDTAMALRVLPGQWGISPDRLLEHLIVTRIPDAVKF